jgi:hypothetical protein
MTVSEGSHSTADAVILDQIRDLADNLSDQRNKQILGSVIDAVALNPQPLPPATHDILEAIMDALNPQPLPPDPPPEAG